MISYLDGTVQSIFDNAIVIDVHGVGYRVVMPEKWHHSIAKVGEKAKVYTHFILNPRDGAVELFGFAMPEELKFFELLTTVSGIGPKTAQGILSKTDLQTLQIGIMQGDADYLAKTAGMGAKTAQRLIVELKEKVMKHDFKGRAAGELSAETDAIDALMALGYSQFQARDAMRNLPPAVKTTEQKITEALKVLGKK